LLVVAAAVGVVAASSSGGGTGASSGPLPPLPAAQPARSPGGQNPFPYSARRQADFTARAKAGEAHVLFTKSPDGALATAARVAAFRPLVDRAVAGTSIDPAALEAIVFLESAGDPNAIAGADPSGAVGLTQIVASTGQSLLGMHINLAASRRLTAQIASAGASGQTPREAALERRRAQVDGRFDPTQELAATVRYLVTAGARFGRADLAIESYHMGIGNLGGVLAAYDGGTPVPYVQLYFDTAPDHHAPAYRLLSSFGDDSWTYYWRILAAEQIMQLYRSDRAALERLAQLQTESDSAAEVLHPPDQTPGFARPADLDRAYAAGTLQRLPLDPRSLGLLYDPGMGELAGKLGTEPALYRGLRPAALRLLLELAARVRALSASSAPLRLTSTVTDASYQRLAGANDPPAAAGWSFTISRRYGSKAQAEALQHELDQLQSLNLIAWQRYPAEIEVTVAGDADQALAGGA
jgi:Transglycosylase SLT domain